VTESLTMKASDGTPTDLHGAAGLGVRGGLGLPDSNSDSCVQQQRVHRNGQRLRQAVMRHIPQMSMQ